MTLIPFVPFETSYRLFVYQNPEAGLSVRVAASDGPSGFTLRFESAEKRAAALRYLPVVGVTRPSGHENVVEVLRCSVDDFGPALKSRSFDRTFVSAASPEEMERSIGSVAATGLAQTIERF